MSFVIVTYWMIWGKNTLYSILATTLILSETMIQEPSLAMQ